MAKAINRLAPSATPAPAVTADPTPTPVESAPPASTPATSAPAPVKGDATDAIARDAWLKACPFSTPTDWREALAGAAAIIRASAPTIQAGIRLADWLASAPSRASGQPLPRSLTGSDGLIPRAIIAASTANRDTRRVLDSIADARKALSPRK